MALGLVDGATSLPLSVLRGRLQELPKDKKIYVYCQSGLRSYLATRQLLLSGREAVNLSGGYKSWQLQYSRPKL